MFIYHCDVKNDAFKDDILIMINSNTCKTRVSIIFFGMTESQYM